MNLNNKTSFLKSLNSYNSTAAIMLLLLVISQPTLAMNKADPVQSSISNVSTVTTKTTNPVLENTTSNKITQSSSKEAIIKGMVCAFCVDTLKKVFSKQKEVKDVQLNLDTKKLILTFNENQTLEDLKIKKLIKASGYDVISITEVVLP